MIKVASYCRVSTDSEDQANSFESQQRYFREYIERHPDWELYEVYADEGITGTSTKKRTQFNRMINDAYLGKFKLIITKEVSRFSRNLLDTIAYTRELKSLGIGVIFMNDGFTSLDPDSELRLSIMGSIAQEESRKTSSRVKWGQTRQMERGVVFGTSLLGYDVCDGKLTINPEGAEIVRLIFQKYGIEKKGTSIIAMVASYCRVSTDKDDQANSFESQRRYFKEYIARQPDWELYKVYADEGITGTSTKKRVQFNQMIHDAHKGKFKLIITKEVSRFSRNILDTIAFTRELKALGVGVLFMNDGINTLDPDSELRLSIMGSIAQEESRKTSARVKWGQTRQMERGVVFGKSMLGYDVQGGKLYLEPKGAEIVKLIFHKYGIEKKGTSIIARELREAGYLTFRGHTNWTNTHIIKILKNEKYVGDLLQKKTITLDYLTHQKKYNRGEEEMVYIRDHHEPIISRELWDLVQDEIELRNRNGKYGAGHSNRYMFSGKIKCGVCGASFVSRTKKNKGGSSYKRWCCYNAATDGLRHIDDKGNEVGCNVGCLLRDELAWDILQYAIKVIRAKPKWFAKRVIEHARDYITNSEVTFTETQDEVEEAIKKLEDKKREVLDAFFSKIISKDDVRFMNEAYDEQIKALKEKLEALRSLNSLEYDIKDLADDIEAHLQMIARANPDDELFCKNLLDKIVVHPNRRVEIKLNLLPPSWAYVLARLEELRRLKEAEKEGCHNNSTVSPLFDTNSQNLPAEKPLQHNDFSGRCHNGPSVPISVSSPFSSSKGME